jgi:hypothetical protein
MIKTTLLALMATPVLTLGSGVAHADPSEQNMAMEAAFCHDVRENPTLDGVRHVALEMIRIYHNNASEAADVALQAVDDVCPDLRSVVMMAVSSPGWDNTAGISA